MRLKVEIFSTFQCKAHSSSMSHSAQAGCKCSQFLKTYTPWQSAVGKTAAGAPGCFCTAPMKRSCVRNLPRPSVTLMNGAPPRLVLKSYENFNFSAHVKKARKTRGDVDKRLTRKETMVLLATRAWCVSALRGRK